VIKWTFRVNFNESSLYYSRIVMAFLRGISLDVIIYFGLRTYQLDCFDRLRSYLVIKKWKCDSGVILSYCQLIYQTTKVSFVAPLTCFLWGEKCTQLCR